MSELTISGRIALILPLQTGTSKVGKPWQKQEYILDTGGQYPKKVCFSLFGDSITKFPTKGQAGKWVEVYTNEQNVGLSPDAPEYCSPFDFELIELA